MSYIYDLLDTWNDGATTFTAVKMNVTDTASNASSLLMDLQVGTVSKFNVRKDGSTYITNGIVAMGASGGGPLFISTVAGAVGYNMASVLGVGWTNSATNAIAAPDTILTRRAAANLRLGAADAAAPVAQTLSVQSVVAGTTNTAGTNLTITGSQGTGTGAGGSIIFQVAPAGLTGTAQNALATALTIASDRTTTLTGALTFLVSGGDTAAHTITTNSGGYITFARAADVGLALYEPLGYVQTKSDGHFGWTASSSPATTVDLKLSRDAANTLALRNGTAAQAFNLYSTYTDASNYERMSLGYSASNDFTLTTSKAGTGSNRSLTFETYGAATFTIAAQTIATSSDGFFSWSSTTTSRGSTDTRLYRDAAGVIGVRGTSSTGGAALSFVEQTAPAAPATNGVRIYAEDNGSGKTRLMALFATGAAVQIAIEP